MLGLHAPSHRDPVRLASPVTRMRYPERKLPVIGQENQSFRIVIQAADGIEMLPFLWQQLAELASPIRIAPGTQITPRFVDSHVKLSFWFDGLAIHSHPVLDWIDFGAQLANNPTVHPHAAGANDLFAGPT